MHKHWNKILALFMGALMLLAILPVGTVAAAAEEEQEIVIYDHDPRAHKHEHEHEHEGTVITREELDAHKNPNAKAQPAAEDADAHKNPHAQAEKEKAAPDKVEDPNAHKKPAEPKMPETHRKPAEQQDTHQKPVEQQDTEKTRNLNADEVWTYLEDPISVGESTFEIASANTVVFRPFTPETTGTYAIRSDVDDDTYGYLLDSEKNLLEDDDDAGNGNNFFISYELTAGVTYWVGVRYYSSEETGSIKVVIIDAAGCTHENTYSSYNWVDNEYVEIPGDNVYHNLTGNVIYYICCEDCGQRFEDEEPTALTVQEEHSYDENGVCRYCGYENACTHESTYYDWTGERCEYTDFENDNWDHLVYCYETYDIVCSNCEVIVGTAEELYDSWWDRHTYENGVCTLCGHVNTCTHTGDVSESWEWDYTDGGPTYAEIPGDDYNHNATGKVIHYTYCCDCGEHLSEQAPVVETRTQSHSYGCWDYDPDTDTYVYVRGECYYCGHECSHSDLESDWYWIEDDENYPDPYYEEIVGDHMYHNKVGYLVEYTYCDICGQTISEEEPTLVTKQYNHSYYDDNPFECARCGHNRAVYNDEPLSVGNSTFVISSAYGVVLRPFTPEKTARYAIRSDTGDDTYGYLLDSENNILREDDDSGIDCDFLISYELTAGVTYWVGAGYLGWTETGEIPVVIADVSDCTHENAEIYWYWFDDEFEYTEIPGDNKYHNVTGNVIWVSVCPDCGQRFEDEEPTPMTVQRQHDYDNNGVCVDCGHVNACQHLNSWGWYEWVGDVEYTDTGDNRYHTASGTARQVAYCPDCETYIFSDETVERTDTEDHWYNGEGVCFACGHVNTCTHQNTNIGWSWESDATYSEIPGDNFYHNITVYVTYFTYCEDCGIWLSIGDSEWKTWKADHYYDSNGVCYECGHVNTCTHEKTYSYYSFVGPRTYTEIEGDNHWHLVSGTACLITYCSDCGMELSKGEPEAYEDMYEHNYDSNGVCYDCGHVNTCAHEYCYTWISWDDVTYIDDPNDNKYHTATGTGREYTMCGDCGIVLSIGELQEYTTQYYHYYNTDGVCRTCDHVNTCTHENLTTYGWWTETPKIQDWGDKHQYSGIAEFWEYCADCEASYTEKQHSTEYYTTQDVHVYNEDGVCYYCNHKELTFTTQPKDKKIATGKTAKFSVKSSESGAKYQWYYSTNNGEKWTKMSGETGTSISVKGSVKNNGYLYRCMVTANGGKASSNIAKLTVTGVKPRIATQPKKLTVPVGYTATFKVSAAGTGLSYQWYYSKDNGAKWTKWSGKTSASVSVKSTAKNNGTLYRCVVKNSKGSVTSSSAMMTVDGVKPRILTQPAKATVKSGKTATFKVVAAGVGLKYQWYYSKDNGATWTKYKGKTSATLKVKGSKTTNGYLYRCKITNDTGSVTSKAVKLTVSNVKPKIVVQPAAASVKSGKTAKFTVVAAGSGLKYQWYYSKNSGNTWTKMSGKTAATLSVKASKSNKGYLYRCIIKNTKGSVTSKSAKLTVK